MAIQKGTEWIGRIGNLLYYKRWGLYCIRKVPDDKYVMQPVRGSVPETILRSAQLAAAYCGPGLLGRKHTKKPAGIIRRR